MATIRTAIELQDNFTTVLYQVISSVNLGLSAMEDLHRAMDSPIDTASIDAAKDSINQATIAVQKWDAAMQAVDPPASLTRHLAEPVVWRSDNMEVFAGTGTERFEQEVQHINNMLDTLNSTQERISKTAAQTDLFPANTVYDMDNIGNRLQVIQQRIQQIESNPLNMGTATANSELEQLRGSLNQAVQEQENLNRAVENMDVQAANEAYLRLSQTVGNTERYIRDNVDEQGRFNQEINEGVVNADNLMSTIKGAIAGYATIQTVAKALDLSDTMTQTTARLNMMNDGLQTTEELQQMIFASAQRSRGSYQDTADAVSKLGLMAGDAFGSSEEIVAFMEQVNKQFTIAGTETAGIEAAMLQLTQAMGSGVLRGEEYNSILEQAPNIIQAIADYMDVPKGQLKDMAAEGQITADIVKAAMFAAANDTYDEFGNLIEGTNSRFESMPMTFSQIWTSFQNTALMAFQPVLNRMNEIANSDAFQNFVNNGVTGLSTVAGIALEIVDLLVSVASTVADNWSWLSPIIYGVAAALIVYYTALGVYNGIQLISNGIKAAAALQAKIHAASLGMETGSTFAATAAQYGFNAALLACPLTWILLIIIAVIAAIYGIVAVINKVTNSTISATGLIAAAFAVLGAHIINTFVVPAQNMIATFINFLGNAFNDPIAAIKIAFYDVCLTVIGYIRNLASGIETLLNKIPGVSIDITSGLDSLYSSLEEAQQAVKDESGWVEYVHKMDYIDYSDAAAAGYAFGQGIEDKVSGAFASNTPSADDYSNLSNYTIEISDSVHDIAEGVGSVADITEEDLKYLRDIAEQETVNRFTTAEITIHQTNNNNISNETDLDGIVDDLVDGVNEAIDVITEGVHE